MDKSLCLKNYGFNAHAGIPADTIQQQKEGIIMEMIKKRKGLKVLGSLLLLCTVIITSCSDKTTEPGYYHKWEGIGTIGFPFRISSVSDLEELASMVNKGYSFERKFFILTQNLSLEEYQNGKSWIPIGYLNEQEESYTAFPFSGYFNGNGFLIDGLYINKPDSNYQGLFGYLYKGIVENLILTNVNVTGKNHVGAIAGRLERFSMIGNCIVKGNVTGDKSVGGIAGSITDSSFIYYSSAFGTVSGNSRIGGLTGENGYFSFIYNSYNVSEVFGTDDYIGGIAGQSVRSGGIKNSYNRGNVSGTSLIGGITGYTDHAGVLNCYSTGLVTGNGFTGGLIGQAVYSHGSSELINKSSYWNVDTSGQEASDGGKARDTAEMTYPYSSDTYVDWDFSSDWAHDTEHLVNDGYPYLIRYITDR